MKNKLIYLKIRIKIFFEMKKAKWKNISVMQYTDEQRKILKNEFIKFDNYIKGIK